MVGDNYKPKPPRILRSTVKSDSTNKLSVSSEPEVIEQIAVDLNWWESCEERPALTEQDRAYLNSIIIGQAICPRMAFLRNEERARKLLGLEGGSLDDGYK